MVCENGGLNGVNKQICNKPLKKTQRLVIAKLEKKWFVTKTLKRHPKKSGLFTNHYFFCEEKITIKSAFAFKKKFFEKLQSFFQKTNCLKELSPPQSSGLLKTFMLGKIFGFLKKPFF